MVRQRYRVAPEPPPQLSLREEVAIYKAKLRAIKAARIAAKPVVPITNNIVIKSKKRSKKRNENSKRCIQAIGKQFKTIYHEIFSDCKRKFYKCLGFACCMTSEMRVFVDEEFPKSHVPVV